jgi:hypothetical protein
MTAHTVTGLTNDTEYMFRVAGVNHTRGDFSSSVAATPSASTQNVAFWADEATDPYWDSVSLLLNFDGADGSNTFTDSGPHNLTSQIEVRHDTAISTAQSKFGGSSGFFYNTGPYGKALVLPSDGHSSLSQTNPLLDPGAGDFTAECWVYPTVAQPRASAPFRNPMYSPFTNGGYLETLAGYGGPSSVGSLALNEWSHVAVCREGSSLKLFLNGALSHSSNIGTGVVYPLDAVGAGSIGGTENGWIASWCGYLDDFRYTKGVARYEGTSAFAPPASAFAAPTAGEIMFSSDLQPTKTIYGGDGSLSITATAYQSAVSGYQWQKQDAGSSLWENVAGATANSLALSGLSDAADTGDSYRCLVTGPLGTVRSAEATLTIDESGINGDNRFRVTAAAATTTLSAAVDSTTGYWKMVSSTGQSSAVLGHQYAQYSPYYFNTGSISGMPSGAEKTVEVFSCDASGNPSGELEYVSFAFSSQAITAADASGCTSLQGFNLSSSASPYSMMGGGSGAMPAALVSVRAVGVAGNGGFYSQYGPYPANVASGVNVSGQTLQAAALDQLYADLANGLNTARIFVGGNPGTASDDPTIATAKGYTIFGS